MRSATEELVREIEAAEFSPAGGTMAARASLFSRPNLRGRVERAAIAALVRCLDARKFCATNGVIEECADGGVIVKAATELLNRTQGKPPTMAFQITADMGSSPPGAETWTPEMIAAVQAQLDQARSKLGGAVVLAPSANRPETQRNAEQNGANRENGAIPGIPAVGRARPWMKKSAGAAPTP